MTPLLYSELAEWFPLLTARHSYAAEAAYYTALLRERSRREVREVLELGCGGGHNASHMKADFALTLSDVAAAMLALSARLNPECEHVQGDMRELRLGRDFDAVFVHDAVMYLTTEEDLARTMATAHLHLREGGVALFAADCVRETFEERTWQGGHDGDGRSLRYLQWWWDPDPADSSFRADFVYLLREGSAPPRAVHDHHRLGMFERAVWLQHLREVGFRDVSHLHPPPFDDEPVQQEIFVGIRRPARRADRGEIRARHESAGSDAGRE